MFSKISQHSPSLSKEAGGGSAEEGRGRRGSSRLARITRATAAIGSAVIGQTENEYRSSRACSLISVRTLAVCASVLSKVALLSSTTTVDYPWSTSTHLPSRSSSAPSYTDRELHFSCPFHSVSHSTVIFLRYQRGQLITNLPIFWFTTYIANHASKI